MEQRGYHWLHLSDLHISIQQEEQGYWRSILHGSFHGNEKDKSRIETESLSQIIRKNPVDGIILTGDVFFRGDFTKDSVKQAEKFLTELYKICSEAGNWEWQEGQPMDRLFYCPGNHDLDRDASQLDEDGVRVIRERELPRVAKQCREGRGRFDDEKLESLFIEESFQRFFHIMAELTGNPVKSGSERQACLFQLDKPGLRPLCFVGFNTAILAGQMSDHLDQPELDELNQNLDQTGKEFFRCHTRGDVQDALGHYQRYAALMQKKSGKETMDIKRLCFPSEKAMEAVTSQLKSVPKPYVIFFGHHPYEELCPKGLQLFQSFAEEYTNLYLCGHTHIPKGEVKNEPEQRSYDSNEIYQVNVGGVFPDAEAYNETSIAIGTLTPGEFGDYPTVQICYYCYRKDPVAGWLWMKQEQEPFFLQGSEKETQEAEDKLTEFVDTRPGKEKKRAEESCSMEKRQTDACEEIITCKKIAHERHKFLMHYNLRNDEEEDREDECEEFEHGE